MESVTLRMTQAPGQETMLYNQLPQASFLILIDLSCYHTVLLF